MYLFKINLRMFDEGGAALGGSEVGTTETENTSTEKLPELKHKKKSGLENVVYGKQEELNPIQEQQDPHQHENEQQDTTEGALNQKQSFEDLIKGDYKEDFEKRTQEIINKRFKETKTMQEQIEKLNAITEILRQKYNVNDGDLDGLANALQADDTFFEEEASKKGMTVEQYKQFKRLERENAIYRKSQAEIERQKQIEQVHAKWNEQSIQLKQLYPDFDFSTELNNQNFGKLLSAGLDVKTAYETVHIDDIKNTYAQQTAQKVAEKQAQNIQLRQQRPTENGLGGSTTGVIVKNDVRKLSPSDRREIARLAGLGEKITF